MLKRCAEADMGGFVRLLGFTTLSCGCIVGRYRELATSREVNYVEEKGNACKTHGHRRNHTISDRIAGTSPLTTLRTA
jgi:hypothetical protein